MNQYLVAFITGITTGGLSCLAVQGGLLASSFEKQLEQGLIDRPVGKNNRRKAAFRKRSGLATPILLFLGAKVIAYTLLGFLLGAVGSVLKLTPEFRAVLLIIIGIFMIGNALRMLNVHPIFRYFVIEPPRIITRFIRKTSKNADLFTPIFLGALTILIPCGVTQAMMAVAIGTSDPWQAAGLMFAFTLGTSPVFFIISYLATELGSKMESIFLRLVAVVILVLGMVSIDSGFTLLGFTSMMNWMQSQTVETQGSQDTAAINNSSGTTLQINASNTGYSPRTLHVKANTAITLNLVTDKTYSCARDFLIPDLSVERLLPDTGVVSVEIPAQKIGTVMNFTCSMGMYTGVILFDRE